MISGSQFERKRGACAQCARRKRKCDHKKPRCSHCERIGVRCEPQTFKFWTAPARTPEASTGHDASVVQAHPETRLSAQRDTVAPGLDVEQPGDFLGLSREDGMALELQHDLGTMPLETSQQIDFNAGPPVCQPDDVSLLPSIDPSWNAILAACNLEFESTPPVPSTFEFQESHIPSAHRSPTHPNGGPITQERLSPQRTLQPTSEAEDRVYSPIIDEVSVSSASQCDDEESNEGEEASEDNEALIQEEPLNFLYCPMPWPSEMVSSPKRRFLWKYFLHATEKGFLCLELDDPRKRRMFQDPYLATLPHMALCNDTFRKAAFCFASFQYNQLGRNDTYWSMFGSLAQEASVSFLRDATSNGQDDRDTLSIIAAGTMLHHFSPESQTPFLQLSIWLASRILPLSRRHTGLPQISVEIVLALLRWTVISSTCSLQLSQTQRTLENIRRLELRDEEVGQNLSSYSPVFKNWIDHPLYAFSSRLINPLLQIGRLLQMRQIIVNQQGPEARLSMLDEQASEIETVLLDAHAEDFNLLSNLEATDPDRILSLNEAMFSAAFILLYARVKDLPSTAPIVRRHVQNVVNQITKIDPESRTTFAVVFPLFIAGCEAVDLHIREPIVDLLRSPKGLVYNRGDLVASLHHIWDIRDVEPGLRWMGWLRRVNPQLRIGNLM